MTYAGAGSLLSPAVGLELPDREWAWQVKVDGCYAEAHLDDGGRIAAVLSRNGQPIAEGAELLGIAAGPPRSILIGELESHTEAGVAAAAARGHRLLHLFDCAALGGESLSARPYLERWGALHRAQSMVEGDGAGRVRRVVDATGRLHDDAGRFVDAVPRDLRRLPIIPLLRGHAAAREAWRAAESGAIEGLVAVRLGARLGVRGGKRKIKTVDTLEATVVGADGRVVALLSPSGVEFRLASRFAAEVRPGQVVEVAHHGWYQSGSAPRFARVRRELEGATVVRIRWDLGPRAVRQFD